MDRWKQNEKASPGSHRENDNEASPSETPEKERWNQKGASQECTKEEKENWEQKENGAMKARVMYQTELMVDIGMN